MTTSETVPTHDSAPPRNTAVEVRSAAVRLIAAAVAIWALLSAIGYALSHWLNGSTFEKKDLWIDRWFAHRRSSGWNAATQVGSHLAETMTVIAIGAVVFVALRVILGRWRESIFILIALVGEVTIFVCTTLVIDRARPPVAHLDAAPPTSSFPSGHTAASIALYGSIALVTWSCSDRGWLRKLMLAIAVVVPILVGLSRLYRGMHYPTDVLGGALLGVLWLMTVSYVLMRSEPDRGRT